MADSLISTLLSQFAQSENFQRTLDAINSGASVLWDGCLGASYALLGAALEKRSDRTLLVVESKVGQVERAASDLAFFTGREILSYPILSTSSTENSDEVFLSEDADFGARLRVLKALDRRAASTEQNEVKAPIVVASLAAIMQPVPSRELIKDDTISLQVGVEFERDRLVRWLSEGGFHSTTAVELPGEYSVRGHIVDIYAVDWENPARVEFFGDEIDSIRRFDVVDQRSLNNEEHIDISRLRTRGVAEDRFIDRLPNDTIVLMHETDEVIGETTRLVSTRSGKNENETTVADTVNALYRRPVVHAVTVASGTEFASESIISAFYSVERLQGDLTQVERIFNDELDDLELGIVCSSEAETRRLEETFRVTKPAREGRLHYTVGSISSGFEWRAEKVAIVGSDQLFGRSIARRTRVPQTKKLSKVVDSFMELQPGDLVIHVDYGIARYIGIEKIKKANQYEDHLKLEFANKAYLYVPASRICKIQRYVGVGSHKVKLAPLKGTAWKQQKKKVQQAVWAYAGEMIELQAARDALKGIEFPQDGPWQSDFESLFPYRETDDQLTAIDAVKKDMERPRPMDRLICGDVGFGKTEVALRAAFKAVEAGYQVAVLVPTTVLAEQHYRTFSDRTSTFPVRVAPLSRYSTKKEQEETLKRIKSGDVDIVIGTHRIVQKDVKFKNLGLVVIDEEQKFGVKDKERLKQLRNLVDVLTMTATPIPRTLHFSLLGIRDISNLATPPADRLPVETRVLRYNPDVVRNAIVRELNRGGQVYYLHNQVYDIADVAAELHRIVPEARIRIGHAQMPVDELETTMRDFILKKFDVLVCTTIVESGLDIANANTIFIDRANRFGLAELHQLRGRVGREKKQAYCYLMLDANQPLSSIAAKRLHALEEYDKLGAGFQIAMKDLEIRGAGNILGTEQSGHIAAIGYEMYCDFLDAAVRALKNEPQKLRIEIELDLPCNAILNDDYVPDPGAKIDFYRRFDRVSKFEEAVELRNELLDRFGKLPPEAEHLFVLAQIRLAAFEYRVKQIQVAKFEGLLAGEKMLSILFRAPDQMYRLQSELKKRHIKMNLVDTGQGVMKGYVSLPLDLFEPDGSAHEDDLLEYTLNLFSVPHEDAVAQYGTRQEREKEKRVAEKTAVEKKTTTGNPLDSAIKRVKDRNKSK